MFLCIREEIRENEGNSDDDMNVIFIQFKETAQSFQEGFLLVEFITAFGAC